MASRFSAPNITNPINYTGPTDANADGATFKGSAPKGDGYSQKKNFAQDTYGEITRGMWEDYKKRYHPIENQAISDIKNKAGVKQESVDRANDLSDTASGNASEALQRRVARTGGMTSEQRAASDKSLQLSSVTDKIFNANTTRQREDDRLTALQADMINVGRTQRADATSGFGSAAQLEQGRNATNRGISAQNKSQKIQLAGAAIGIAVVA